MKRLLLPPLAAIALPPDVNAFPFFKNLEFKNDIGTKVLIRGDNVKSVYLTKNELIPEIQSFIDQTFRREWRKEKEALEGKKREEDWLVRGKNFFSKDVKEFKRKEIVRYEKEAEDAKRKRETISRNGYKAINKIRELDDKEFKIHVANLSFQPITIDLNGNKTIGSNKQVSCFNPNLKPEIERIWEYYSLKIRTIDNYARQIAICKKYAKFK